MRIVNSVVQYALGCLTSPKFALICGEPLFLLLGLRSKRGKVDLSQVKRILVVRLDEIGDVVVTTPLLRELRRNIPRAWITLVVKPAIYNLVELCPYVNEVLTYDWQVPGNFKNLIRHARALRLAIFHLWKRRFDLAILPRWGTDYYHGAFLSYFSGTPWRVGYSEFVTPSKHTLNKGYDRLFTDLLKDDSLKHEAERDLELIKFLGERIYDDSLELWIDKEDESFAQSILNENNINKDSILIGIGLGAGELRKMWPMERFLDLIKWLSEEMKLKILLLGDKNEVFLGRYIENNLSDRIINMLGKTNLRQAVSLLKHCKLYIGNDSGIKHIAAAVQVPVVELSCCSKLYFNKSQFSPYHFGPWKVNYIVVCPEKPTTPCKEECAGLKPHCILQVTVEDAMVAVRRLLSSIKNG